MRRVKEVKEEIRKDVNEYMRQAEKLDGNKSFKKTYDDDGQFGYLVEMDGSKMKLALLYKGKPYIEATNDDMSDFDRVWDGLIQKVARFNYGCLSAFIDSFKEKMNEFVEEDELSEPVILKSNGNGNNEIKIDLKTKLGYCIFYLLFEFSYGLKLSELFEKFNFPQLDDINGFDGAVILHHKDDERTTFMFNPTSRLGRLIVGFAKYSER